MTKEQDKILRKVIKLGHLDQAFTINKIDHIKLIEALEDLNHHEIAMLIVAWSPNDLHDYIVNSYN